jgi:hypothetical protein
MLTKMLVPKPKNALKSPVVHMRGRNPAVDAAVVIARSPPWQIPNEASGDAQVIANKRTEPFDGLRAANLRTSAPGGNRAIANDRLLKTRKARANRPRLASSCTPNAQGHEAAVESGSRGGGAPRVGAGAQHQRGRRRAVAAIK